jgi:hypothetical protein
MDAKLTAAYQALKDIQNRGLQGKEIHVFVDSQATLKRLQKNSLTRSQKVCYKIMELYKCQRLDFYCPQWIHFSSSEHHGVPWNLVECYGIF